MSVLIACDSFKGSLSAPEVCESIAKGIRAVCPNEDVVTLSVSDGGDGLMKTLKTVLEKDGWKAVTQTVTGPYGKPVCAEFCLKGDKAIIEMAQAAGLHLTNPEERAPQLAGTFGVGELIRHAVSLGARRLFIGLGGSATNDLGLGCLQALGVRFFDADGMELDSPFKARDLARIARIETRAFEEAFGDLQVTAVCDVTNPLLGPSGATAVFGPQKGIRSNETPEFERAMHHASECLKAHFGADCRNRPGAGAAGGLGAGLMWFFNADMVSGAEAVLDLIGFDQALTKADFVITGEGSFDAQSIKGKAPFGVLKRAKQSSVPVYLFAGRIECKKSELSAMGFKGSFSLNEVEPDQEKCMQNASILLSEIGAAFAKDVLLRTPK